MDEINRMVGFIPARAGSKGIPNKNLVSLQGKPLIQYTIEAARGSDYLSEILVSTDGKEIAGVAKDLGAHVLLRPAELAQDATLMDSVILHMIQELELKEPDIIVLLQPTSPLRTSCDIDNCINEYLKGTADGVLSISEQCCPFKAFKKDAEGYLQGHFGEDFPFLSRQQFEQLYFANGAVYVFGVDQFMREQKIPRSRLVGVFMDKIRSVDVDNEEDLKIVSAILGAK